MANPPAGWHPDPLTRHAQRYWDGNQWTEHVADQSGNMSTDPLDGGQSQQADQSQADQSRADQSRADQSRADQSRADQSTSQWGGGQAESSDQGAWGQSDTASASGAGATAETGSSWGASTDQSATGTDPAADTGSSWGSTGADAGDPADTTTGSSGTEDDLPSWQSSDTREADATAEWSQPADTTPADTAATDTTTTDAAATSAATDDSGWGASAGAGAGAAGAAAAAGSDADRSAPVDDEPTAGDSIEHVDTGSATASHADVTHPTVAVVTVGTGVVVRNGHVVAASSGLSMADSDHPGSTSVTGAGTVHVGAGGREITVLDVPASGLTVADDALVAHSAGLTRAAAADGIVGYDGTSVSGGGWVAIAAVGGTVEVSPVGGVDVTPAALVAWSSDLDVSHAENVSLSGRGTVLVSSVTS